ncbi:MAG TPA: hypothetical protein ENG90_11425, partial [Gammaproteobacteria bacterium]|nr:hypothetical protein [Gammaproteobacteria bacterium]
MAVAPLAGAWIETDPDRYTANQPPVAPLAGAWIETPVPPPVCQAKLVAPLAGAWIETLYRRLLQRLIMSR